MQGEEGLTGGACCSCEEVRRILEEKLADLKVPSQANGKRRKRAPSAYNLHIKDCMQGGKSDMKTCAAEYKQLSEEEKAKYKEMAKAAQ